MLIDDIGNRRVNRLIAIKLGFQKLFKKFLDIKWFEKSLRDVV